MQIDSGLGYLILSQTSLVFAMNPGIGAMSQATPKKAQQQSLDPASRLAVAKRQSALSAAELGR